jgi:hypothetical protein
MDFSERKVYQHLASRGFNDIVYEPDGNVAPEFLVNRSIAIEVRRLNQHRDTEDGPRGLEVDALFAPCSILSPAGVQLF